MKTIYLIRHGETINNVENRAGRPNDLLTERGQEQARLLGRRLSQLPIEIILSSPYDRAKQSAEELAKLKHISIETSDLLIESRNPSEFDGMSNTDPHIIKTRELLRQHWGDKDFHYKDEENFFEVSARAKQCLQLIANRTESHIAVYSHEALIKMMGWVILAGELLTPDLSTYMFFATRIGNTGITVVTVDDTGKWQLVRWNDTIHLEPSGEI